MVFDTKSSKNHLENKYRLFVGYVLFCGSSSRVRISPREFIKTSEKVAVCFLYSCQVLFRYNIMPVLADF